MVLRRWGVSCKIIWFYQHGLIKWIRHRKEIRKLTFRALALRRSESRNCGLCVVYIQKNGVMLLVALLTAGAPEIWILGLHTIKKNSKTFQCIKSRNYNVIVRFLKLQIFGRILCTNLQSPVLSRHVVYLQGTPTWRPENSVNIWNLLSLPRSPIIWTNKANI